MSETLTFTREFKIGTKTYKTLELNEPSISQVLMFPEVIMDTASTAERIQAMVGLAKECLQDNKIRTDLTKFPAWAALEVTTWIGDHIFSSGVVTPQN